MKADHILDEFSQLHTSYYFNRASTSFSDSTQNLFLTSTAPITLYQLTKSSGLLVEAFVEDRLNVHVTSTATSSRNVQISYNGPSWTAHSDLRCMDVWELETSANLGLVIALGIGNHVFVLYVSLREETPQWRMRMQCTKSDVMAVSMCANSPTMIHLMAGTRSGLVLHTSLSVSMNWSSKDAIPPDQTYSYTRHKASVSHVYLMATSEFIVAYTDGTLLLSDLNKCMDTPTRIFNGHRNHFMQGLVSKE